MDIKEKQAIWLKEKPLFEAKLIHSHLLPFFNFNENTGDYEIKNESVNHTDDEDRKVAYESLNTGWAMWLRAKNDAKAQAVPEGFVLVSKAESTGLTDKNEKLIFVGDVVEFVGGCRDFLDLSGVRSPLYTVNKGDKMIVRKLKSGYTLSLPWIDCDTPNRIGNLGNYDFWNLRRDFIVIEAQEQSHE
ncbi:MAG: hypothetical protein RR231_16405 [Acinetobacter sp.]